MKQTLRPGSLKNYVFLLKIMLLYVWFSPLPGFCSTAAEGPLTVVIQGTDPACGGFPNGSAVAIASGGTAPYTYLWNTGATTAALDFIFAGTYSVTVTDVLLATASASVTLTEPPVLLAPVTNLVCGASGSITVSPTGGVPPYTFNWTNGATTPTISNLSPGDYCVTVVDANYCGIVTCASVGVPPNVTVITTDAGCDGGTFGSAKAFPSGGTPPYTYLWNTGQTTQIIQNLAPGIYSVTVTDSNGCTGTASCIVEGQADGFTVSLNATAPGCAANNGTITAIPTGGNPPFVYSWSNGGSGQTIMNLGPGMYSVTVTEGTGCSATASIILNAPMNLDVIASATNETCYNADDGTAFASALWGLPPYTFAWSNGATGQSISNLSPGTYIVTATDSEGCTGTAMVTVASAPFFTLSFMTSDVITCGCSDGSATVFRIGGTAPFSYLWSTGSTAPTILDLSAGTYSVTVTDGNGCEATGSVMIESPPDLNVSIEATTIICENANSGTATATVNGGTAPFSFLWNTGATTPTISDLPPGTYSVTVTDAAGCEGTASVGIIGDFFIVDFSLQNVLCYGDSTGIIVAAGWGGVLPYTYLWNTGSTNPEITNLPAGIYSVTVTDALGCAFSGTIEITEPPPLGVNIASSDGGCIPNSGMASANAFGGTPPYRYLWNTGDTTQTISNLPSGTYSVTIEDANLCTATACTIISLGSDLSLNINSVNISCYGELDGFAMVIATGGTPPYTYLWNTGAPTGGIAGIGAGTYSVTVTDATGCTDMASVTLTEPPPIVINISVTNASCGSDDGSLSASVSGGVPPFSYAWSNGESIPTLTNLAPGTYFLTVTDADNCTNTAVAEVLGGDGFTIDIVSQNISCYGANDGFIFTNIIGGAPPFSFQWNTGSTFSMINNLPPGQYSVTVTDAEGCVEMAAATITEPAQIALLITKTDETCAGSNDGTASVVVSNGGVPPFSYLWSTGQTTSFINGLTPDTYSVTVTDANGCTEVISTTIDPGDDLSISISASDVSCYGGNDGLATVTVTSGSAPFSYSWSNGESTQSIFNLTAGTYSVTVTDANGCSGVASVIISQPSPMLVLTSVLSSSCEGSSNGSVSAIVVGGQAPFTFAWSNGDFGISISNLSSGNYSVTVTDADGCTATATEFVPELPSPTCTASVTQEISTIGGSDGEAVVVVSGGTPPYAIGWSNGQDGTVATNLSAGTYTVTVVDFKGCSSTCSVTLMDQECDNVTDPGTICCDQSLCGPGNDPDPIVETSPPVGGVGTLEYLWMFHTAPGPFDPNVWTVIPDSNGPSYDPGLLFETTYFIRCVRRDGCIDFLESNIVVITVDEEALAIINGPNTVCFGDLSTYAASPSGEGATYEWDFGFGATPPTANTQIVPDVEWSAPGLKTVTLTVVRNVCTSVAFLQVIVTDSPIYCGGPFVITADPLSQEMVMVEWDLNGFSGDDHTFVVERSADMQEFEEIGEVERVISVGGENHYEYFDKAPKKGRSFYRVKLIDSTGEFVLSNTEEVLLMEGIFMVFAYPNPVEKRLFLEILDDFNADVTVDIITINGILLKSIDIPDEAFRGEIDVSFLPKGMYIIVVNYDGKPQKTIRVVKV